MQISQLFVKADTQVIKYCVSLNHESDYDSLNLKKLNAEKSVLTCTFYFILQVYDTDPDFPRKLKINDKNSVKSLVIASPILVLLTIVISNYNFQTAMIKGKSLLKLKML